MNTFTDILEKMSGTECEHIHRYFGKNEWNKMFDAWVYFCFRIDDFEIFLTETKGLGIK